jgi:type III secretion system needle length determinant
LETFPINRPVFPSSIPIQERPVPAIPFTRSDSALETFPIDRPVFPSGIPIQERPVPAIPFTRSDSALETFPIDRPAFATGGHLQNEPPPVTIQTVDLPYSALPLPRGKASCETPDATPIDANPLLPSGDRILQGLFGQPYPSAPLATPSPVSSSDRMDQLAERLAQRILVSDRTHTGDSEVRIQLRETVLQGAEITFRRDQGQLVVSFNVVDAHVAQQLSPQTDDLQRILATRLDTSVRIEVNVSSGEAGGQGSPGDGRSRNRRDLRDEWDMDY